MIDEKGVYMNERILIETKLSGRYKNFLEYCADSEKIFIDELSETDFIAYRAKYAVSREEIEILKTLVAPKQGETDLFSEPEINLFTETTEKKSAQNLMAMFNITDLESYKNVLITDLPFKNRVQNQLKKNNCSTLVELLNYSVEKLSALRNFGDDSVKNVFEVLENFFGRPPVSEKSTQNLTAMFKITDLEPYKNVLIESLNFNSRVQNQLKKNGCDTLSELLNYSVSELSALRNFGSDSLKNVLEVLENFFAHPQIFQKNIFAGSEKTLEQPKLPDKESLKNFAEEMINAATKTEKQRDIICKRAECKTLGEIGKILQITRERVRQIESKAVKNFSQRNRLKLKILFDSIRELLGGKNFVTFEDLKNFTDESSAKILWFFISKIEIFYLDAAANAVIFHDTGKRQIDYDEVIKNLPEILREDEFYEEIERIVKEENCSEELLKLKILQIYKRSGHFFHRGRLTLNFRCGYILRERFQNGYKISDETHYNRFVRYLREFFDYQDEISQRALDANIGSYIGVLCDRGKYIHPDFLHVPQKIILLINDYIEKSERTVLPYKEIFTALKKDFVGTQITNPYILQGVIKYYGTPYTLSRDCLTKNSDVNLAAEFNNFVEKNGEVSTPEIKAEFISFQDHNITMLLQRCHEVIYIGGGKYLHSTQLNFSENDSAEIEKFLQNTCSNEPISSRHLFNLFWEKFQDFLHKNKIEDHDKLFGILKYMFEEKFNFSRPYVSSTDITGITNKKVLLKYFENRDEIEIEDLLNLCEEKGILYVAKTYLIENLIPEFIRVDEFYLRRPESIGVTDEVINSVVENVQLVMERNGGWQSAKTFPDFEWLPHLEIPWNSFLLESIVKLSENNFKILHFYSSAGEFSTAIFVSEEFAEEDFDSFSLKILTEEHERDPFQTKQEVLDWLKEKGLTNKKLPKIIEERLTIDAYGKISLQ